MRDEREELIKWFHELGLDDRYTLVSHIVYLNDDKLMDVILENCNIHILKGVKERYLRNRRQE